MILLAIECSSSQGSLALLQGGTLLAQQSWSGASARHNVLFDHLNRLMDEAGLRLCDIGRIVVGRGPGSFSGMRMSFAVAQALALPNKIPVQAVSSGAAAALRFAEQSPSSPPTSITVAGDARRGQLWTASFTYSPLSPFPLLPAATTFAEAWRLVPYDAFMPNPGVPVISPDAERISRWAPDVVHLFPSAAAVGRLALLQPVAEPLDPLYMHPPVRPTAETARTS